MFAVLVLPLVPGLLIGDGLAGLAVAGDRLIGDRAMGVTSEATA
jgi:hypothetical protein